MKIRDRVYKKCSECGTSRLISDVVWGCDGCGIEIELRTNNTLFCTNYHADGENDHHHFCSWKCFFDFLPTIQIDYFMDFPYLGAYIKQEGLTMADFWKALKGKE